MNDQQRAAMQMALEALEAEFYDDRKQVRMLKAITALREALAQPQENTARCGGCNKTAKDGWALYCVECWEKTQPQDTECPCGSECEKCSTRCLPQESFSDCIWYTYIDFNEKPPYFRYDTGDNTAKENESTYYEIQEELKQFGYTIEDVYINHDTICGDIVSINKELAQPLGEWVDLTDDELMEVLCEMAASNVVNDSVFAKAVIAVFKEKNTPVQREQQEPVAYTNKEQLGYLKDERYKAMPMAMWAAPFAESVNVPLYTTPPSVEAAIEETKEKIAKWYDEEGYLLDEGDIAAAIRSMK